MGVLVEYHTWAKIPIGMTPWIPQESSVILKNFWKAATKFSSIEYLSNYDGNIRIQTKPKASWPNPRDDMTNRGFH